MINEYCRLNNLLLSNIAEGKEDEVEMDTRKCGDIKIYLQSEKGTTNFPGE